jgi:hypothetical protein
MFEEGQNQNTFLSSLAAHRSVISSITHGATSTTMAELAHMPCLCAPPARPVAELARALYRVGRSRVVLSSSSPAPRHASGHAVRSYVKPWCAIWSAQPCPRIRSTHAETNKIKHRHAIRKIKNNGHTHLLLLQPSSLPPQSSHDAGVPGGARWIMPFIWGRIGPPNLAGRKHPTSSTNIPLLGPSH